LDKDKGPCFPAPKRISPLFVIRVVAPLPKAGAAEAIPQNAGAPENIGPPRVDNLSGNA
jgi:hypothetical protein